MSPFGLNKKKHSDSLLHYKKSTPRNTEEFVQTGFSWLLTRCTNVPPRCVCLVCIEF